MKVTLTHDGKSVELDLTAEQMTALGLKEEKKKTGYERGELKDPYYFVDATGSAIGKSDMHTDLGFDDSRYLAANYYRDMGLAKDNNRADRLMRQLRRFAAENGGIPSVEDWKDDHKTKHCIRYSYPIYDPTVAGLSIESGLWIRNPGIVYFNDKAACAEAIIEFHDELIWYFTEYEAMLR